MAKDYKLITAILTLVIRCLFAYQRKMAKRAGHRGAKPAAVTFVQRWGRVINANLHFHVLLPDGVFVQGEKADALRLFPLPPPTDEDIVALVQKIAKKVTAFCQKRFATIEDMESGVLDGAIMEAMRKLPRAPLADEPHEDEEPDHASLTLKTSKRCAAIDGFTVHANTVVPANNRFGLDSLFSLCASHNRLPLRHAASVCAGPTQSDRGRSGPHRTSEAVAHRGGRDRARIHGRRVFAPTDGAHPPATMASFAGHSTRLTSFVTMGFLVRCEITRTQRYFISMSV